MNITKLVALGLVIAFVAPSAASAAVIGLSSATSVANKGATFSVTVSADSSGEKAYTVRANLSFDPTLLEFVSWSFAPKWLVLSQAGYDTEDNAKGILVKTAGYPGGVTSSTVLGTAVFRTKLAGTATVAAGADSLVLDKTNKNLLSGGQGIVRVTISSPAPAVTPAPSVTKPAIVAPSVAPVATTSTASVATTSTSTLSASNQTAAVAEGVGQSFAAKWIILGVLGFLILVGAGVWFFRKNEAGV